MWWGLLGTGFESQIAYIPKQRSIYLRRLGLPKKADYKGSVRVSMIRDDTTLTLKQLPY